MYGVCILCDIRCYEKLYKGQKLKNVLLFKTKSNLTGVNILIILKFLFFF